MTEKDEDYAPGRETEFKACWSCGKRRPDTLGRCSNCGSLESPHAEVIAKSQAGDIQPKLTALQRRQSSTSGNAERELTGERSDQSVPAKLRTDLPQPRDGSPERDRQSDCEHSGSDDAETAPAQINTELETQEETPSLPPELDVGADLAKKPEQGEAIDAFARSMIGTGYDWDKLHGKTGTFHVIYDTPSQTRIVMFHMKDDVVVIETARF